MELAIAGARKHNSTIAVLPSELSAIVSQEVQSSSSSCPPWLFPSPSINDTCRCGESIHGAVKCNETLQLLELQNVNDEDFLPHRLSSPEHYSNSLEDSVAASITDSSSCSSNDSSDEN